MRFKASYVGNHNGISKLRYACFDAKDKDDALKQAIEHESLLFFSEMPGMKLLYVYIYDDSKDRPKLAWARDSREISGDVAFIEELDARLDEILSEEVN